MSQVLITSVIKPGISSIKSLDFSPISSYNEVRDVSSNLIFQDKNVAVLFEKMLYESRKSTSFEVIYSSIQQILTECKLCAKHCAKLREQQ